MSQYPEHEKLSSIKAMSQPMGELLEYFEDKGYFVAEWQVSERGQEVMVPVRKTITLWLAEIFAIDLVKLEAEKDAMLQEWKEQQHDTANPPAAQESAAAVTSQ